VGADILETNGPACMCGEANAGAENLPAAFSVASVKL
jgi:hypothetical protein